MHVLAAIGFSVLLLLGIATPAGAQAEGPASAVQRLLDQRREAIASNDRDAYLATVDPQSALAFQAAEATRFAGAVSSPMTNLRFAVRLDDSGDLAAGLDLASKHAADQAYLPETRRVYRVATYDQRDASDSLWYTYVRRGSAWYVAADDDVQHLGVQTSRALWDFGPVATTYTDHFAVVTSRENVARGAELGATAERAFVAFQQRWPLPWSERLPLIVPDTAEQAGALLRTGADPTNFVAFVTYSPIRDADDYTVSPPRLLAQDENLLAESAERQTSDLVHELVHAASADLAGPFSTTWIQEGLAEYIRLGSPSDYERPTGTEALPNASSFAGDRDDLRNAYAASTSAMVALANQTDEGGPERFFTAVGDRKVTAGTPSYNVDQAMRSVAGVGLQQFTADWLAR